MTLSLMRFLRGGHECTLHFTTRGHRLLSGFSIDSAQSSGCSGSLSPVYDRFGEAAVMIQRILRLIVRG